MVLLRTGATGHLKTLIATAQAAGSVRLFSVRHEFPNEWAMFQNQAPGADQRFELALSLRDEHFPFWSRGRLNSVKRLDILARSTKPGLEVFDQAGKNDQTAKMDPLAKDSMRFGNLLVGRFTNIALPPEPVGKLKLFFDERMIEDLWIAVTWSSE